MGEWHIAQMNVATARYPLDDPRIAEFVGLLDEVNALAEASPGFVWRPRPERGSGIAIAMPGQPTLVVNMSVWQSVEALVDFVYKSAHRLAMAKGRDWFAPPAEAHQVLWWVKAGERPSPAKGLARLHYVRQRGPTRHAFGFKNIFPPPAVISVPIDEMRPER